MYFVRIPRWIDVFIKGIIWRKEPEGKCLYLTFDDGPNPDSTYEIVALLSSLNVKATFFCVGERLASNPEMGTYLKEEGHVLANHNFQHYNGWRTRSKEYLEGVIECQKILEEQNLTAKKLYRPPYGKVTVGQLNNLKSAGFNVVNWSLMPGDFEQELSEDTLLKRLLKFKSGDIIVLHDNVMPLSKLKETLSIFVIYALEKGYKFKTL